MYIANNLPGFQSCFLPQNHNIANNPNAMIASYNGVGYTGVDN